MTKDIFQEFVPYINIYLLMLTFSTFVILLALLKKIFSNSHSLTCPYGNTLAELRCSDGSASSPAHLPAPKVHSHLPSV